MHYVERGGHSHSTAAGPNRAAVHVPTAAEIREAYRNPSSTRRPTHSRLVALGLVALLLLAWGVTEVSGVGSPVVLSTLSEVALGASAPTALVGRKGGNCGLFCLLIASSYYMLVALVTRDKIRTRWAPDSTHLDDLGWHGYVQSHHQGAGIPLQLADFGHTLGEWTH
jgi:hypothetical protein